MSNNRKLGNLAQFLDSGSTKSVITASGGAFATEPLLEADLTGTQPGGLSDSNLVKNIIDINYITETSGYASVSDAIPVILQNTNNIIPDASGAYDLGDSAKPISELILDSSANIFFGAFSLTSILKSGTSSIAVAAVAASAEPVSSSAETLFLLKTDSTQTDAQVDASTNALTITENGNVTSTAFTPYHPKGYGFHFDGSNDTIKYDKTGVDFTGSANKDMVFECWYNVDAEPSVAYTFLGVGECDPFRFLLSPGYIEWHAGVSESAIVYASVGTHNPGQWYHLACVRTGDTVSIFRDGTRLATASYTTEWIATGTDQYEGLWVGCNRGNTWFLDGKIAQLRLIKGSVTGYDATATSLDVPTAITEDTTGAYLVLNQPNFSDGSSDARSYTGANLPALVLGGHDHVAYSPSSHGGSVYFDGTADYLDIANNSGLGFGTSDFTVEAWVYWKTAPTSYEGIFTTLDHDSTVTGVTLCTDSTGRITFNMNNASATFFTANNTGFTPQANQWYHIAMVRSSSAVKIYVNGKQEGQTITTYTNFDAGVDLGSSRPARIGEIYTSLTGYEPNAYIADLRVVNGTAVYTADFTPPTEPLTAISGTQLLTCTNKNSVWDASGGNLLTVVGNTTTDTNTTKYSSSSLYFDGSGGDYVSLGTGPQFDFGTGDFTWEAWAYPNGTNRTQQIFSVGDTNTTIRGMYYRSTNKFAFFANSTLYLESASTYSTGQWYHVAVVRSGNDFTLYVDGTSVDTSTQTAAIGSSSEGAYIGTNYGLTPQQDWNGYIEDVRITKGVARYTANFTPPTAALEG